MSETGGRGNMEDFRLRGKEATRIVGERVTIHKEYILGWVEICRLFGVGFRDTVRSVI